jgi:hypothetical protein
MEEQLSLGVIILLMGGVFTHGYTSRELSGRFSTPGFLNLGAVDVLGPVTLAALVSVP